MKLNWIASAALAIGASALIPTTASADYRSDYRNENRNDPWRDRRGDDRFDRNDRHDHDHGHDHDRDHRHGGYVREFDYDVNLRDVPRAALETARCESRGREIEAVQFVFRDGKYFYRFRIHRNGPAPDINIRVTPAGRLLSVQVAGRDVDGHR